MSELSRDGGRSGFVFGKKVLDRQAAETGQGEKDGTSSTALMTSA